MMQAIAIEFDRTRLIDFCRRHGVARLAIFGSVAQGKFGPRSDIDILVAFLPGATPGLLGIAAMEDELATIFEGGRAIDLRTVGDLSPHFRDAVVQSAQEIYAAA